MPEDITLMLELWKLIDIIVLSLPELVLVESQSTEIEKYSDRKSKKKSSKQPLSHFIRMEPDYVPAELAKGL